MSSRTRSSPAAMVALFLLAFFVSSGIPTFTVEVLNLGACQMEDIHLSCGWFSSARLVKPRVFRRLGHDDCLLNDGRPLPSGFSISFQYANSHHYPLSISNATCVH